MSLGSNDVIILFMYFGKVNVTCTITNGVVKKDMYILLYYMERWMHAVSINPDSMYTHGKAQNMYPMQKLHLQSNQQLWLSEPQWHLNTYAVASALTLVCLCVYFWTSGQDSLGDWPRDIYADGTTLFTVLAL